MSDLSPILQPATPADAELVFDVKKAALAPYSSKLWDWDDGLQRQFFIQEFDPTPIQIIVHDGQNIGTVTTHDNPEMVMLDEIYILPAYQNQGIGTCILTAILAMVKGLGKPLMLQVHKASPARHLYDRLGFVQVGETEGYYLMKHD